MGFVEFCGLFHRPQLQQTTLGYIVLQGLIVIEVSYVYLELGHYYRTLSMSVIIPAPERKVGLQSFQGTIQPLWYPF